MLFNTMQEIEDMLKELKISTKGPIGYKTDDMVAKTRGIFNSKSGDATKRLNGTTQCSVFDPEIAIDTQFMQNISDSFSQCSAMNAKINQKLDELDEIMSKSINISRYTQDEKAIITQVQTIYETLYSALQSIIDSTNENTDVGRNTYSDDNMLDDISSQLAFNGEILLSIERTFNGNDFNEQDNIIKIDSSKYGDSVRTRSLVYMRWINSLKECMDSIQNTIGSLITQMSIKLTTAQHNLIKHRIQYKMIRKHKMKIKKLIVRHNRMKEIHFYKC